MMLLYLEAKAFFQCCSIGKQNDVNRNDNNNNNEGKHQQQTTQATSKDCGPGRRTGSEGCAGTVVDGRWAPSLVPISSLLQPHLHVSGQAAEAPWKRGSDPLKHQVNGDSSAATPIWPARVEPLPLSLSHPPFSLPSKSLEVLSSCEKPGSFFSFDAWMTPRAHTTPHRQPATHSLRMSCGIVDMSFAL